MNSQAEQTVCSATPVKARSGKRTYAIHWKSTLSGRIGTGTVRFAKEEAERLAKELNEKYPDIDHEAVIPAPASVEPGA